MKKDGTPMPNGGKPRYVSPPLIGNRKFLRLIPDLVFSSRVNRLQLKVFRSRNNRSLLHKLTIFVPKKIKRKAYSRNTMLDDFGRFLTEHCKGKKSENIEIAPDMRIVGAYGSFEDRDNPQFGFLLASKPSLERL